MWVVNALPDIHYASYMASSITEPIFSSVLRAAVLVLNQKLKHMLNTAYAMLCFPRLDALTLRLLVYADESVNKGEEHHCQLGYIIFLADDSGQVSVIQLEAKIPTA
jgi:hypothetical protein